MKEIWKPLITWKNEIKYDFTGFYEVSNFGNVRSLSRIVNHKCGKQLKQGKPLKLLKLDKSKNYLSFRTSLNSQQNFFLIHKAVWESFHGKVPDGYEINHIDENPLNNRLDNLNLLTHKQNMSWGTIKEKQSKPIIQCSLNDEFIKEWSSAIEIFKELGFNNTVISKCCSDKQNHKTAYGFKWKFL